MRQIRTVPRRDPAPSRMAYRMQRLLLTPFIRRLVWVGFPVLCLSSALGLYLADQERRDAITLMVHDIKAAVRERPEFMVKLMAIDGASAGVADDIREAVPVDFPVSSFDLDLPQMLHDVAALDAVARADLRIRPGGVLQIEVVERVPVAVWRNEDSLDLLDVEGHRVAPLASRSVRHDLPLIAGWGAEKAVAEGVALVATGAPLSDRLRGLVRVGERRWDVILADGQRIMLPEEGAIDALEQVIALDQAQDILARNVVDIDMRNNRRPTVRLGEVASEELRQIRLLELGVD